MIESIPTESSYCKYCKKEISAGNKIELSNGFHENCLREITNYNTKYKQLINNFKVLQQLYTDAVEKWTFSDIINDISKFRDTFDTEFDFSFRRLESLDTSIDCLHFIESLQVSHNRLTDLPLSLSNLKKLQFIDLTYNKLKSLPGVIVRIPSLETLLLENNFLTSLPSSLVNLKKLSYLDVSFNNITYIPSNLAELSSLEFLSLSQNKLQSIQELPKNLKILDISYNEIQSIPQTIINNRPIELYINNNPIKTIPKELFMVNNRDFKKANFSSCNLNSLPETICDVKLETLNIANNNILELPKRLGENAEFKNIDLSDNPLKTLPENLLKFDLDNLKLDNTNIESLPETRTIRNLLLRNTPIAEFPPIETLRSIEGLDICGTNIEKIPAIVKTIPLKNVYVSEKKFVHSFHSATKVYEIQVYKPKVFS